MRIKEEIVNPQITDSVESILLCEEYTSRSTDKLRNELNDSIRDFKKAEININQIDEFGMHKGTFKIILSYVPFNDRT